MSLEKIIEKTKMRSSEDNVIKLEDGYGAIQITTPL